MSDLRQLSARLQRFLSDVLGAPPPPGGGPAAAGPGPSAAGDRGGGGSRPSSAGARPGSAQGGGASGGGGGADPEVALAPLPSASEAARLQSEADALTKEAPYSGPAQAARAWLMLRGGAGEALAAGPVAKAPDDASEAGEASGVDAGGASGFEWEWWALAQAHYQAGNLPAASAQLRRGAESLRRRAAAAASAAASAAPPQGALEALLAPLLPRDEPAAAALAAALDAAVALKDAGNAALKRGDADAAEAKYTEALQSGLPPAFAAVVYCNRAAAHQAASRWTEALADCGRAAALSPGYAKAHSRAAGLLLELRRPAAAASVLEALIAGAAPGPGGTFSPASRAAAAGGGGAAGAGAACAGGGGAPVAVDAASRRAYEERLAAARRAARWARTPHHYRALGLEKGAGDEDVRRRAPPAFPTRTHTHARMRTHAHLHPDPRRPKGLCAAP
jgi:tetratricopeptide (TPR) repeat protein